MFIFKDFFCPTALYFYAAFISKIIYFNPRKKPNTIIFFIEFQCLEKSRSKLCFPLETSIEIQSAKPCKILFSLSCMSDLLRNLGRDVSLCFFLNIELLNIAGWLRKILGGLLMEDGHSDVCRPSMAGRGCADCPAPILWPDTRDGHRRNLQWPAQTPSVAIRASRRICRLPLEG